MEITDIQVFHVPAGWRMWTFIKVDTNEGITGWSEVTDSHGSPLGIEGVVKDLKHLVIGADPLDSEKIYWRLYSRTRQSVGSTITKAISGITNALLDIRGKYFGVPVYKLFGGALRDEIPLYWSHCGTTRVRAADKCGVKPISGLFDLCEFVEELSDSEFEAIKTNIGRLGDNPHIYMPGFHKGITGDQSLNYDAQLLEDICAWVGCLVGYGGDVILDLNYNFKTEGYIKVGRMLEDFNLLWLELDSYDAKSVRHIRDQLKTPICSGENLYGLHQYKPFFDNLSMDICSIDILWNGFERSREIAAVANLHEMSVTPHNYYSHLATFMASNWCATIPNLRYMEYDVDDVPERDLLVTNKPEVSRGKMKIPTEPGWGTDISELELKAHSLEPQRLGFDLTDPAERHIR